MFVATDQVENTTEHFVAMDVHVSLKEASEESRCIRALVSSLKNPQNFSKSIFC